MIVDVNIFDACNVVFDITTTVVNADTNGVIPLLLMTLYCQGVKTSYNSSRPKSTTNHAPWFNDRSMVMVLLTIPLMMTISCSFFDRKYEHVAISMGDTHGPCCKPTNQG